MKRGAQGPPSYSLAFLFFLHGLRILRIWRIEFHPVRYQGTLPTGSFYVKNRPVRINIASSDLKLISTPTVLPVGQDLPPITWHSLDSWNPTHHGSPFISEESIRRSDRAKMMNADSEFSLTFCASSTDTCPMPKGQRHIHQESGSQGQCQPPSC